MKSFRARVEQHYSPRVWGHLDAICAVLCFVAFLLIISILSTSGGLDPVFSLELVNYNVGEGILLAAAVFTIITFFLLLLTLILMMTSSYFIQEEERQLLYILGINQPEEEEQLIQDSQPEPAKPKDKLGMEEEGKWTFNGTQNPKMFGSNQQGKWTFGQFRKFDESQV